MKVIFLDIDGVLVGYQKQEIDKNALSYIQKLTPYAHIILASSRRHNPYDPIIKKLENIIDETLAFGPKPQAIQNYLNDHSITNYLIIDDDPSLPTLFPKHVILSDHLFSKENFQKALSLLED